MQIQRCNIRQGKAPSLMTIKKFPRRRLTSPCSAVDKSVGNVSIGTPFPSFGKLKAMSGFAHTHQLYRFPHRIATRPKLVLKIPSRLLADQTDYTHRTTLLLLLLYTNLTHLCYRLRYIYVCSIQNSTNRSAEGTKATLTMSSEDTLTHTDLNDFASFRGVIYTTTDLTSSSYI